ncbi:MAG: type II secretion system protein GspG [Candidatus Thiodiazotropha taylori]|nr:type II secretion system protein GspG [Candidatus Thiodiazotropha taylori]MCG7995783.1 type II secretion system protein GspG [Candidatus Thiodiazotropha taylori]
MNKWLLFFISLIAILVVFCFLSCKYLVHTITPEEMTRSAIGETFVRINLYSIEHHKMPNSFSELPRRSGYLNSTVDGWGREIMMEIFDNKLITLFSLGKDGLPGGEGENSDISQSYWLTKPNGGFWVEDKNWIYEARVWNEQSK